MNKTARTMIKYNNKIPIIISSIVILYSLPDCGTGGCCHIVTDDNNIDDDSLQSVIDFCNEPVNSDRVDKELSILICQLLLQLSFEQRCILFYMEESDFLNNVVLYNFDESLWNYFIESSDKSVEEMIKYYKKEWMVIK